MNDTPAFPPFEVFYSGLENLSPGSEPDTLAALAMLPHHDHKVIVDVGCGTGRTTLTLARVLQRSMHAVDIMEVFLEGLRTRAAEQQLDALIEIHCMDMADLPARFPRIDLLWCEGAAFCMGYANALRAWAEVIPEGGHAVVSELVWLHEDAPTAVKEYFASAYPEMRTQAGARSVAEESGYRVLGELVFPPEGWPASYFDALMPRVQALRPSPDPAISALAEQLVEEHDIFLKSEGSYSYVIYVLERTPEY